MPSTSLVQIVVAVLVVGWLLARRARPKALPAQPLRRPAVLAVVGLLTLHTAGGPGVVAFLVLGGAIGLGAGAARGAVVRVRRTADGVVTSWGTPAFALFAALIAVRFALDAGAVALGVPSAAVTSSILLTLGLSLLGEALVVGQRAAGRGLAARPASLVG